MTELIRTWAPSAEQRESIPEWALSFLSDFSTGHSRNAVCKTYGYDIRQINQLLKTSDEFHNAFDEVERARWSLAEDELLESAIHGTTKPVIERGRVVFVWVDEAGNYVPPPSHPEHQWPLMEYTVNGRLIQIYANGLRLEPMTKTDKSEANLRMILKGRMPEVYGDKIEQTVSHSWTEDEIQQQERRLGIDYTPVSLPGQEGNEEE